MEVVNKVIKCKSSTDAQKLAGSIYAAYQNDPTGIIVLKVVGAGSLNQAVKAAIISNKYFAKKGIVVAVQPSFQDTEDKITSIELKVLLIRN